jgi:transposase
VYGVQDWAEVHRLHHREGVSQSAIATRLGMSRTTVARLLSLSEPPRYERRPSGSKLDPFKDAVVAMLREDARVPATVVCQQLRRDGFDGEITILKDWLRQVRPQFVAAAGFQRTSYRHGEVCQVDWWHTGIDVGVGKGAVREAMGLVATLPASAAHAVVFTLSKMVADFCPALIGCLQRLGGAAESLVMDNDASIVASRQGGSPRLHVEVATLLGQLRMRPVVLRPATPTSKGQVERTIDYLERSFLPLRSFADLADLQAQADRWAAEIAYPRHHRRVGARVADAWRVERGWLQPLPDPLPDVDRHVEVRVSRDGYVRVGGVDYSLPPGLAGRRAQVRLSLTQVTVRVEGRAVAEHRRSWVPADVVLAPAHGRALRLAREARTRLETGDVDVPAVDLGAYDVAFGAEAASA